MDPDDAATKYSKFLSKDEKWEMLDCDLVYYCGQHVASPKERLDRPGTRNKGFDDPEGFLIFVPHDHINYRYELLKLLGKGACSHVMKAYDHKTGSMVAIKIIRNVPVFTHLAEEEIAIAEMLNRKQAQQQLQHQKQEEIQRMQQAAAEAEAGHYSHTPASSGEKPESEPSHKPGSPTGREGGIVKLLDHFTFRGHTCLIFEVLHCDLYDMLKRKKFYGGGFDMEEVKSIARAILNCLVALSEVTVVHSDIKPENIMFEQLEAQHCPCGRGSFRNIDSSSILRCSSMPLCKQNIDTQASMLTPEVVSGNMDVDSLQDSANESPQNSRPGTRTASEFLTSDSPLLCRIRGVHVALPGSKMKSVTSISRLFSKSHHLPSKRDRRRSDYASKPTATSALGKLLHPHRVPKNIAEVTEEMINDSGVSQMSVDESTSSSTSGSPIIDRPKQLGPISRLIEEHLQHHIKKPARAKTPLNIPSSQPIAIARKPPISKRQRDEHDYPQPLSPELSRSHPATTKTTGETDYENSLKLIDFGCSTREKYCRFPYVQSRFYRAPEVILGYSYGLPIDIWSFGCVIVEVITGLPLFCGESEEDQLSAIIEVLGMPPGNIISNSTKGKYYISQQGVPRYCSPVVDDQGEVVDLEAKLSPLGNIRQKPGRRTWSDVLGAHESPDLVDFLNRCLEWDPARRLRPKEALQHPWLKRSEAGADTSICRGESAQVPGEDISDQEVLAVRKHSRSRHPSF